MNEAARTLTERDCTCNQPARLAGYREPVGDAAVHRSPFILNGIQFDLGHLASTRLLCPLSAPKGQPW